MKNRPKPMLTGVILLRRQNNSYAENRVGCLTKEEALGFSLEKLPKEEDARIAQHLVDCQVCRALVRLAVTLLEDWAARTDVVGAVAAAAPQRREPRELEFPNHRVHFSPELGGTRWLLVVEPKFPCPDSSEVIVRAPEFVRRLPVAAGRASAVLEEHEMQELVELAHQKKLTISTHITRENQPPERG
jgi:hypothetical protein